RAARVAGEHWTGPRYLRNQPGPAARRQRGDRLAPPDRFAELVGEVAAPRCEVRCSDLEEAPIAGQPKRRLEQHAGNRLGALDAALQLVLLAERQAASEEGRLVERRVPRRARKRVTDDLICLEKRAQHAAGVEGWGGPGADARAGRSLVEALAPVGRVQPDLGEQLHAEALALGEEELELEQIAQRERLLPAEGSEIPALGFAGAHERQLGDGTVHEEVDDRVPVVRGRQMRVGADR